MASWQLRPRRRRRLRLLHPAVARPVADQGTRAPAVARGLAAEHRARPRRRRCCSCGATASADRPIRVPLPALLQSTRGRSPLTAAARSFRADAASLDRYVALTYLRMLAPVGARAVQHVLHLDLHRLSDKVFKGAGDVDDARRISWPIPRRSTSTTSSRCRCCWRRW